MAGLHGGMPRDERDVVMAEAVKNFDTRAMRTRSGMGSYNQSVNNDAQQRQTDAFPGARAQGRVGAAQGRGPRVGADRRRS